MQPGWIVGHQDAAPYNAVMDGGRLVGFFDWDIAFPSPREEDLGLLGTSRGCRSPPRSPASSQARTTSGTSPAAFICCSIPTATTATAGPSARRSSNVPAGRRRAIRSMADAGDRAAIALLPIADRLDRGRVLRRSAAGRLLDALAQGPRGPGDHAPLVLTLERMTLSSGIAIDELDPASARRTTCSGTSTARGSTAPRSPPTRRATARSTSSPRRPRRPCATIIEESQSAPDRHRGAQDRRPVRELHGRGAHRGARARSRSPSTLAAAEAVDSIPSFLRDARRLERGGVERLRARLFVDNDPGDPERYLVFLEQGGLGAARRELLPRGEVRRHPRRRTALTSSGCSGWPGCATPPGAPQRILALETEIAAHHWDNVAQPRQRGDLQPDDVGRGARR